ncbi:MAG: amidohydrolase [Rhodobiaceae bacterium]|nr:amidohydrolase [Rhodobiaceae bacterium]
MTIRDDVKPLLDDLIAIRRDLHTHPELGFEETRTSKIVAEKLAEWGLEVHAGIAGTGVVGVLRGEGGSNRAIGFRADMDALPMVEKTGLPYASTNPNAMHACGHDGHTTMLLGAARYLADKKSFDGTVYFIFQPAEEGRGGGREMVKEGLFERFPMESVWGMHNMPGIPVGEMAMRPGPCMANADIFEITVRGKGAHGAMPHEGIDPIVVGSHIVGAVQSIVARNVDPLESGVISITAFNSGKAHNVIPDDAVMKGTARSYLPHVQDLQEANLRRIVEQVGAAFGATATLDYKRNYPATVNTPEETDIAAKVAEKVCGTGRVNPDIAPKMGAEDFSFMLNQRPGAYVFLGNGMPGEKGGVMVHNTEYDFNDNAIGYGVSYWAEMAETVLPKSA